MNKKLSLLAAAFALCIPAAVHADDKRPNIIFIMADDLGNADLGYRGGQIQSPNIDKLAQEGVRLESFYGQQVCTPCPRGAYDRSLSHALWAPDAGDLPKPHLWSADGRAHAAASA